MNVHKKRRSQIKNRKRFTFALIVLFLVIYFIISMICNIVRWITPKDVTMTTTVYANGYDYSIGLMNESKPEDIIEADIIVKEEILFKPSHLNQEYFDFLVEQCIENDVPINVILGIMRTENTTYNASLTSEKNDNGTYDMGLVQINSRYHDYFGEKYNIDNFDAYNWKHAIIFITRRMSDLISMGEKDYNLSGEELYLFAAGCYNRGEGGEKQYRNMYWYKERFITNYYNMVNEIDN